MKTLPPYLSKFTKTVTGIALVCLVYGYVCRLAGLYFFWESKSIGWVLFFVGMIAFLNDRVKMGKQEKKKVIPEKIGIGLCVLILFVKTLLICIIPVTDAYPVAKTVLFNDPSLKQEIGEITGSSILLVGGMQKTSDSNGDYGNATLSLTVKGTKKFKDVTVYLVKYANAPEWEVEAIE